jgi:hypothetical protein
MNACVPRGAVLWFPRPRDGTADRQSPKIRFVSGGIFLLRGEDELVELRETPHEAEEVLQALLAKFPSLLAGGREVDEAARRWVLVAREAALPDDEDAAAPLVG